MNITIDEIVHRLAVAESKVPGQINFWITSAGTAFATHWYRPDNSAFDDCNTIYNGGGTIIGALNAIDAYAASFVPPQTTEQLARTLGILPAAAE